MVKKKKNYGIIFIGVALLVMIMIISTVASKNLGIIYTQSSAFEKTLETYYSFAGNVAYVNMQNVMAKSILQIEEINIVEGEKVYKDDVLFRTTEGEEILADIDGTIDKIYIEVDQQVMSGAVLCEIIDLEQLKLQIKVDEYDLDCVEIGKEVWVNVGAVDKDIIATVEEISRTAISQNGVAYFIATLSLDFDEVVKVGMSAETKILKNKVENALVIPMKVINFDDENNPYVYVDNGENEKEKVMLDIGITDGIYVEILGGLEKEQDVFYIDENNVLTNRAGFLPPM